MLGLACQAAQTQHRVVGWVLSVVSNPKTPLCSLKITQLKNPYKETSPWHFNTIFGALCIINNPLACVWEQRELPAGVLKAENLSAFLPGHTHKLTFKQGAAGWATDVSPKLKGWLYILQEVPPSIKRPFSIYSLDLSLEWTATRFSLDPFKFHLWSGNVALHFLFTKVGTVQRTADWTPFDLSFPCSTAVLCHTVRVWSSLT